MNQRGEVTLISCFLLLIVTSILILGSLELTRSFRLLEKRSRLLLCVKETKGEMNDFLVFMGRTNWGVKNVNRLGLIMLFIPGLQGGAVKAQKAKKYLQYIQEARVTSYLVTLSKLKKRGCPLDPRMMLTPLMLGDRLLKRDAEGAAILREPTWNYLYLLRPYLIEIKISAGQWERPVPKLSYEASEKRVMSSFL